MSKWKLVPVEPTEDMVKKGRSWLYTHAKGYPEYAENNVKRVYRESVSAAPSPTEDGDLVKLVTRIALQAMRAAKEYGLNDVGQTHQIARDLLAALSSLKSSGEDR